MKMKLEYDLKMALGTLYFIKLTRGRRRRKNSTVYKTKLNFPREIEATECPKRITLLKFLENKSI